MFQLSRAALLFVFLLLYAHQAHSHGVFATNPFQRRRQSMTTRIRAAMLAFRREPEIHKVNGDENRYPITKIASFTKGLPHDPRTGVIVDPYSYDLLVKSSNSGKPQDQRRVPLGPPPGVKFKSYIANNSKAGREGKIRGFESSGGGLSYDLEGPDAQLYAIPPAPTLTSKELAAEMSELYGMALLRDEPFLDLENENTRGGKLVTRIVKWLTKTGSNRGPFTAKKFLRGVFKGDDIGPIISQFFLLGTKGLDGGRPITDGIIQYGCASIDQRMRVATRRKDYMTTWAAYIDVQNAADVRRQETYEKDPQVRFMATPRDLATFVHYDLPYQAFLNAALILLQHGIPFDEGIPFQDPDTIDKQQGLSHWSAQHVLTMVAEVSTRALKASQFLKFGVHRRSRPEELGGYIDRYLNTNDSLVEPIAPLARQIDPELLQLIAKHNELQNLNSTDDDNGHNSSFLLPMAYPEGSPIHSAYPAGHAVLAGSCATILKAYFDHTKTLDFAFQSSADGGKLLPVDTMRRSLTVEGELNKLVSNIAIGRNWAGLHYFADYLEGAKLGERIAISILEEQALTFIEDFTMTIPTFDNEIVMMRKEGSRVSTTRSAKEINDLGRR
eukprot:Plantae.Rhodophyta-Hildenbrandia_rubra.ctg6820.p1 GENE.Plantae.Rhodophyta-Hildenbrandia_rubra.ctg6820~~Plantae.Rhodophyta-Hildenbrandia_rubra.ctg6820.p1  ORF type:complete len:613 (-),score=101.67 Plantae.Rhodophyta-Hildenbrandia_rubra.ctg6820:129-1967(-)